MKTIILLLSFAWINSSGQNPTVNVWRVSGPVCPDDSVKVDYMIGDPYFGNPVTSVYIAFQTTYTATIMFQGNYNILKSQPKEWWYPLGPGDSCYYIWLKVPKILGSGVCTVKTIALSPNLETFTINPIPKVIISERKLICKGGSFTFSPTGATTYTFISGQTVSPTVTTSYSITAQLGSCTLTETVLLTVNDCTGITEIQQNETPKTYYDLQGNKTEKLYNTLIIEQSGNIRRKVFFIN